MRLNRFLAKCGVASRRKADELIQAGHVQVNGQWITELGTQVDIEQDQVNLDGKPVYPAHEFVYLIFNKPARVLTTVKDSFNRPTVMKFVPKIPGLVPVGRLDYDTEGVLLFSNDGDLVFRLSHPRYQIDKIYSAHVNSLLNSEVEFFLSHGVDIGEKRLAMATEVKRLDDFHLRLTLHEGKKRQVKRMLSALGYRVISLRREQFAFLRCDDLKLSSWRFLNQLEILKLKKLVGFSNGN